MSRKLPWAPILLAAALAVITTLPYLFAYAVQPRDRVFMGFFFLADDANTYLAKMHQGWEGHWIWVNRYSTEPSPGAYFFVFWIVLGRLAAVTHLPLIAVFHLARVAGAFALLLAGWFFIRHFLEDRRSWSFAIYFMAIGLGFGLVLKMVGSPVVFGQQTDGLDLRMPELSAFYSILALPHFAWAAAFQAAATVLTLKAADRGSLRLGLLAGLAWAGESSIHAQMPILIGGATLVALLIRPPGRRGWIAAALAFAVPGPYVIYSFVASLTSPEVLRWSSQWRNNFPPDGLSFAFALAPQLLLAALALPSMLRRRSREDVFLIAWLVLLAVILWVPTPAANLRRRFFDGIYLALVVMAARGLYAEVLPHLRSLRARRLVPFTYVAVASISSTFLLLAPLQFATKEPYVAPKGVYDGLVWLQSQPSGVVLSTENVGLVVPAYTADTVYVGQYSETFNWNQKAIEARRVLKGDEDFRSLAVAGRVRIRYVFWTEDAGGTPAGLETPAFSEPGVRIYRLY